MTSLNILNYKDIDVNEIVFSSPEKLKGGSYISVPKYNNEPIYIQTPRLINKGFTKSEQRCSIELELDNTHLSFYEFITNIDDFNIVEIQKKSKSWFKQEFPLDVVEEFYKSPVKMARSKNAPSLKVKIPLSRGSVDCAIYNNNNQMINYSQIKNEAKVLTVLHFYGLRFLKQQVICEWVPIQIKIFDNSLSPENNYLIDDSLLSDNEYEPEESFKSDNTDNDNSINTINNDSLGQETNQESVNVLLVKESKKECNTVNETSTQDEVQVSLTPEIPVSTPDVLESTTKLLIEELNLNNDSIEQIPPEQENNIVDSSNIVDSLDNENQNTNHDSSTNEDSSTIVDSSTNEITKNVSTQTEFENHNIDDLRNIIQDKNLRIEFLENKIRELFKYLSNN